MSARIKHEARLRCQFCQHWFWRVDRFKAHTAAAHAEHKDWPPHIEFTQKADTDTKHRD